MARQYNFIYKKLVDNESDIIGIVAYSLYKTDKISFIEDFKKKNNGQEPTEEEFRPFHDNACMDSNIERYKMQATNILQGFLDDTLSSISKQLENNFINTHKKIIEDVVKEMKPKGFWYGVKQSIVASAIFLVVMSALLFCLVLSHTPYTFTLGNNGVEHIDKAKKH